jgi:hypothetical protein
MSRPTSTGDPRQAGRLPGEAPRAGGQARPASARRQLLTLVADFAAPLAVFYGLRAAGTGPFVALASGAVPPLLSSAAGMITRRKASALGLSVLAMMALGVGASLVSGSPRFLLAKDGWLTGAWAAWFFTSLLTRRPATFVFARPLLEGRRVFDPAARAWVPPAARSWDQLWDQVPAFRRAWRVTTVIWAAAMLTDAVIRITMAWTLPVDTVPALGAALWPVTFIVLQVITNVYFHRTGLWAILRTGPHPGPR